MNIFLLLKAFAFEPGLLFLIQLTHNGATKEEPTRVSSILHNPLNPWLVAAITDCFVNQIAVFQAWLKGLTENDNTL